MGDPKKHHYLPVFYLRQWAGEDGRLVEYSKPHGDVVKPRRGHPDSMGYHIGLYQIDGVAEEHRQAFEKSYLSKVDSRAADVLKAMLDAKKETILSEARRRAWAGFVNSLMGRMPRDIEKIKEHIRADWLVDVPGLRETYAQTRAPTDPTSLEGYLSAQPDDFYSRGAFDILGVVTGNRTLQEIMIDLEWSVVHLTQSTVDLLTSDRPLLFSSPKARPTADIILPIGPKSLFIASRDDRLRQRLTFIDQTQIARIANVEAVSKAQKYVFGRNDRHLRFVQNRMGSQPTQTLIDRMHELRMARRADRMAGLVGQMGDAGPDD